MTTYTTFTPIPGEQRAKKYTNCAECGEVLPEKGHKTGRYCRECMREYHRIYKQNQRAGRETRKQNQHASGDSFTVGGYRTF